MAYNSSRDAAAPRMNAPRLDFGAWQKMETRIGLRVDPKVVLQGRLLELSQAELELAVETELAENPALMRHDVAEPVTEAEVLRKVAPQELAVSGDWHEGKRSLASDEPTSWVELASVRISLQEHLLAALLPELSENLRKAGEWAIHSLDSRGYLAVSEEELALECGCSLEEAALVIQQLQRCEPPGIGARTVQECLVLQAQGPGPELALTRRILTDGWDEFVAGKLTRISRKFRVPLADVQKAAATIREFNPFPGEGFLLNAAAFQECGGLPAIADLVIDRTEAGWQVSSKGITEQDLGIEPFYRRKMEAMKGERSLKQGSDEAAEARHIHLFVRRAGDFIDAVAERRRTMIRIGQYLSHEQAGFLSTGSFNFLRPLTKSQMAKDLGLHESTVSRATADKHVQLPSGEILSFDVFFKASLRVQKMIEEILQVENPSNPLSDEAISKKLAEMGVDVARRTVHKYRDRARLSSSRRRRAA